MEVMDFNVFIIIMYNLFSFFAFNLILNWI